MENSENKSLISKGGSNLAKTEKLLSITQKILSEIKPQYESVRIGNQEWMTRNVDVDRFRNGDLIPHIESNEEWEYAGENGQPAWCYYDNDPEYGEKCGKLYNWYAVNDPRGLAPEGYHVPTNEEWTILEEFLGEVNAGLKMKSVEGWEGWDDEYGELQNGNGDNSSGFNGLPCGFRVPNGRIRDIGYSACFWSATEMFNTRARDSDEFIINGFDWLHNNIDNEKYSTRAWSRNLFITDSSVKRSNFFDYKQNGNSVRCVKD
jgi:uncharacterized protein (TIGR02145 family)